MKIFCIGRNYAAHAHEMHQEAPHSPVLFMKSETALADKNKAIPIPSFSNDFEHELEIVLHLCDGGKNISRQEAFSLIDQWTVGIDFTARDVQRVLKEKGLPWELSKSFDGSAVVGEWVPFRGQHPASFHLLKNGEKVQEGHTELMLFPFDQIISFISQYFTLSAGDIIYTGTPVGVSKVNPGDILEGFLNQEKLFSIRMA